MRTVSAADANRQFSKILRAVAAGEKVIVTSRGKPVAEMNPVEPQIAANMEREAAHKAFLDRLRRQPAKNLPRLTRDDFYD